ncbi:glycosyltransferase family 2 protein [Zavarzinia compransoris]|uniref:glycosyltransferase family 2 protein n=1 Tax=Zavarzinia compransoris TaxID=1264899 RepID=UPI0010E7A4CC|nr:glycosyltransferase family 2 protein [Zavarzinia compransoris]TDP44360.1 glycosyltransferase involved in cell wall biosynthesis [Zavarzinia compransoris]
MSATPLISLVVATRERAATLEGTLAACRLVAGDDIEIVVCDNASADDTPAVIAAAAAADPRITAVRRDARGSMRQNYGTALAAARGDYVCFFGDDDAPLPGGIAALRHIIRTERPDAVGWSLVGYDWPGARVGLEGGVLSLRARSLFGGLTRIDVEGIRGKFANAAIEYYRDGINIYHGCVSRRVIERVEADLGTYFFEPNPDLFSCISNLWYTKNYLFYGHPVTLAGVGPKSIGAAFSAVGAADGKGQAIRDQFRREVEADPVGSLIGLQVRSVPAHTFACVVKANEHMPAAGRLPVDARAWALMVLGKGNAQPPHEREATRLATRLLVERLGAPWTADMERAAEAMLAAPAPVYRGNRLKRADLLIPAGQGRIDQVVLLVERLLGRRPPPELGAGGGIGKALALAAAELRCRLLPLYRRG